MPYTPPGTYRGGPGGNVPDPYQGLDQIAAAIGGYAEQRQARRQQAAATAHQNWIDELTLRKYLDESARSAREEQRQARLDADARQQQARTNLTQGFMPSALVTPEMRNDYIERIGPHGTVERAPRYQSLVDGEVYDTGKSPEARDYSKYLFQRGEDTREAGEIATAVGGMRGQKGDQTNYQGIASVIGKLPPKMASQVGQTALENPMKIEVARAGAQMSPAWNITPMDSQSIMDRALDDIAALSGGDPAKAAELAKAQGMDAAHIEKAKGRAINWRIKNTMNIATDSMMRNRGPKTKTPTGGGE